MKKFILFFSMFALALICKAQISSVMLSVNATVPGGSTTTCSVSSCNLITICTGIPITFTVDHPFGAPADVWNFTTLDGSSCAAPTTLQSWGTGLTCTYSTPGTYNVQAHAIIGGTHNYYSGRFTVTVTSFAAEFSASTACLGDPTIFTYLPPCVLGGTTTWTWDFGDGYPVDHTENPVHTYASPGTYNVVLTVDESGSSSTVTHPVTVHPLPPAPVISGSGSACTTDVAIEYIITNFDPTATYSMFTPVSPIPSTPSIAVISPVNGSGLFTITWKAPVPPSGITIYIGVTDANGCQNTTSLFIGPCCTNGYRFDHGADGSDFFSAFSSSTASNQLFSINGTFTVDNDMTWDGCNVKLGPNAIIDILPGKTLTLINSHLSACTYMWDKIRIEGGSGGTPGKLVANTNTIIKDAKTAVYSEAGGAFDLNSIYLDRNYVHITATPFSGTHPGVMESCYLSCSSGLNPPYTGQLTNIGFDITGCDDIQVGVSGGGMNSFYEMNTGILSTQSNITALNNGFFGLQGTCIKATGFPSGSPSYSPVNLTVGDGTPSGTNYFSTSSTGIFTMTNMNLDVLNNNFQTINGDAIVFLGNEESNTVHIDNNDIYSSWIGIHGLFNSSSSASITNNRINMSGSTNLSTGIYFLELPLSTAIYNASNNLITEVQYGLRAENVTGLVVRENTISLGNYSPPTHSIGVELQKNNNACISQNNIKRVPASYDPKNGGIYANKSPNSYITCNTIKDLGFGIKCGGNMPSYLYNNAMINDFYGIWLDDGCIVGPQFSHSNASYNTWSNIPVGAGSYRLYASLNTFGSLSPFTYRTGLPIYDPSPYSYDGTGDNILANSTSVDPPTMPACSVCPGEKSMVTNGENETVIENTAGIFKVYPNPATNQLTIHYELNKDDVAQFDLYNLLGEKIAGTMLMAESNQHLMNLENIHAGVYLGVYTVNGKTVQSERLVVIK